MQVVRKQQPKKKRTSEVSSDYNSPEPISSDDQSDEAFESSLLKKRKPSKVDLDKMTLRQRLAYLAA